MSGQEPQIRASAHAYAKRRLQEGSTLIAIRQDAIREFVDLFADSVPDKALVDEYRKQVVAAVDEALRTLRS